MTQASDRAVIDHVERSVLVTAADRARRTATRWLAGSRSLVWLDRVRAEVASNWGATLFAAAVVHFIMIGLLAPPSHVYGLVLPGVAAAAGLAQLIIQRRSPGGRIG